MIANSVIWDASGRDNNCTALGSHHGHVRSESRVTSESNRFLDVGCQRFF